MEVRSALLLLCLALCSTWALAPEDVPHSRQKRILWVTNDGRLALPPGTSLVLAPSLSMPFIRNPPEGFFSNITVSLPFTSESNCFLYGFSEIEKLVVNVQLSRFFMRICPFFPNLD